MTTSDAERSTAGGASLTAHFSWMQTRMTLERTLLAWVRTAASLIAFGFAIVHFFAALDTMPQVGPAWKRGAARLLGTSLVVVGTLALALASIQNVLQFRYLDGGQFREISGMAGPQFRPAMSVTLALLAVGIIVSWALLARLPR